MEHARKTVMAELSVTVTWLATSSDMFTNMHEIPDNQRPRIAQFTVRSFQVFPEDNEHLDHLRTLIFKCMVIKEAKTDELELVVAQFCRIMKLSMKAHSVCSEKTRCSFCITTNKPAAM